MEIPKALDNRYKPPELRVLGTLPELTRAVGPYANGDYVFGTLLPLGSHTS